MIVTSFSFLLLVFTLYSLVVRVCFKSAIIFTWMLPKDILVALKQSLTTTKHAILRYKIRWYKYKAKFIFHCTFFCINFGKVGKLVQYIETIVIYYSLPKLPKFRFLHYVLSSFMPLLCIFFYTCRQANVNITTITYRFVGLKYIAQTIVGTSNASKFV